MVDNNKAELKHYKEWLEKEESTLIDALLILNETNINGSMRFPNIILLNNLVSREIPASVPRIDLKFPYQSTVLLKIKDILSLILSGKLKILKKPDSFVRFDRPYYFSETFQNRFPEDSNVLMKTTVKPLDFVVQLLEYKNILPDELRLLVDPVKEEPSKTPVSKSMSENQKPINQAKPIDPREEKLCIKSSMRWSKSTTTTTRMLAKMQIPPKL